MFWRKRKCIILACSEVFVSLQDIERLKTKIESAGYLVGIVRARWSEGYPLKIFNLDALPPAEIEEIKALIEESAG